MRPFSIVLGALALIAPSAANAQLRAVPDQPASRADADGGVTVYLLNESDTAKPLDAPPTIDVTAADGTRLTVERADDSHSPVPPGGFVRLRYRPVAVAATETAAPAETKTFSATGTASALVDRFEPHEPTYGAFGLDDAGAKLQVSFAFRPFENAGALDGVRFAYTQTIFWAIDQSSGPVRSSTYSPEVYYEHALADDLAIAAGYRHDSNGGGDFDSIDVNRIFLRGARRFDLGGNWHAEIAPEAWLYVGKLSRQERISDYWGYTAVRAAVEQDDGIKLALYARGNPATGKGGAEFFASYPLARIGGGLGFYLFGQAFTGYGEALDDYREADSHARLGIALTR